MGDGGADIYELRAGITCWRDFPISDFSLQNCIGCNIEGLVIFGIWCVLVCHCPHGCAAGLKLNKVAVRNENQTES